MNIQDKHLVLERYAFGKEDELIDGFILDGPSETQKKLKISDEKWRVIFDYLVFEKNLLFKTAIQSAQFFVDEYVAHGMTHVREMLDVADAKYDEALEIVFDFVAVANEGLYFHVLQHRDRYMLAFRARGGDFVRKVLGIWRPKYDETWRMVLDVLLNAVCDSIFSEHTYDRGLKTFSKIMNGIRDHRPLIKHDLGII